MTDASTLFTPIDHRRHQRIDVRLPASIVIDHMEISVTLINISMGGAKLEVPSYLNIASQKIQLRLPANTDLFPGVIKWSGLNALGVEFQAEGSSREQLDNCINSIMQNHVPD